MAGSANNWFKPAAGPLKGQSVYLSKAQQTQLVGSGVSPSVRHNVVLSGLNAGGIGVTRVNTALPNGVAKKAPPPPPPAAQGGAGAYTAGATVTYQANLKQGGGQVTGTVAAVHGSAPLAIVHNPTNAAKPYSLVDTTTGKALGASADLPTAQRYMNVTAANMAKAPAAGASALAPAATAPAATSPAQVTTASGATVTSYAPGKAVRYQDGQGTDIPGTITRVQSGYALVQLQNGHYGVLLPNGQTFGPANGYANPSAGRQAWQRAIGQNAGQPGTGAKPPAAPTAAPAPTTAPPAPAPAPAPVTTGGVLQVGATVPIAGGNSSATVTRVHPNGQYAVAQTRIGTWAVVDANGNQLRSAISQQSAVVHMNKLARAQGVGANGQPLPAPAPTAAPAAASVPRLGAPGQPTPTLTPGQAVTFGRSGTAGTVHTVAGGKAIINVGSGPTPYSVVDVATGKTLSTHGSVLGARTALNGTPSPAVPTPQAAPAAPAAVPPPAAGGRTFQAMTQQGIMQMQRGLAPSMTPTQVNAVRDYTDNFMYQPINQTLRGQQITHPNFANNPSTGPRVQQVVSTLDGVFKSNPNATLQQDIVGYRRIRSGGDANGTFKRLYQDFKKDFNTWKVGDVRSDKGYMSATVDQRVANGTHPNQTQGGLGKGFNDGVLITVRMPRGTKAIAPSAAGFTSQYNSWTAEMLINRGSNFRVVSVDHKTGQAEIEIIP